MQIKTKLNFNFMILAISLVLTGYIGIKATQNIYENHLLTEKVTDLLFTQNKMIFIAEEVITVSDLSQLQDLKNKFDELKQSFDKIHTELENSFDDGSYNQLIANEKNIETTSNNIFEIHQKKLIQQTTFLKNYPLENTQRKKIRSVIFSFNEPQLTKMMGDAQYYSKESLYQHRDQKHVSEWFDAVETLKTLISETDSTTLSQAEKEQLLKELDQYKNTAKIMGKIAIEAKNIEIQEAQQIIQLQKVIQKSEKTSLLLKNKIAQTSVSLLDNILLTQIVLIGIIVAFAFMFSTYISRSISATIHNLRSGVEKITKGDLETKIQVSTKDEFSKLANAFNDMTGELRQTKNALEENNRTLEHKVSERTEELQQAVHEVRQTNEQLQNLSLKLSKYLAPQVYQSIFSGKKDVKLESYRKQLTVFFSDIQGFTNITDSLESEALTSLLNTYLDEMSKIALHYGGTIDKFIGDGIMIFFGDPETKGIENDALACVQMGLAMRERMKYLQQQWKEQGISDPLKIRIGINTGYCTAGNFGSESRLDYTIIGGQVNLASRLESNAEADQILISHETYALVKDRIRCEKKEQITVKGIAHPVQTYQVINQIEKLATTISELKEEFDGFKLSIDLNHADKEQVRRTLTKAIEGLDQ